MYIKQQRRSMVSMCLPWRSMEFHIDIYL